jgi:hypothetical protein
LSRQFAPRDARLPTENHQTSEVSQNAPGVLADAAYALACIGEDIDAMIVLVDRALTFNPSYARGWHSSGFLRLWAGQTDLAIEHAYRALRLSPRAQRRAAVRR